MQFHLSDEEEERAPAGPAPVGGRAAGRGPFGAEDLAGNVWEWCRDAWGDTHPLDGVHPCRQGDTASHRVVRGGSWRDPSRDLRSVYRLRDDPEDRDNDLGFRVVLRPAR